MWLHYCRHGALNALATEAGEDSSLTPMLAAVSSPRAIPFILEHHTFGFPKNSFGGNSLPLKPLWLVGENIIIIFHYAPPLDSIIDSLCVLTLACPTCHCNCCDSSDMSAVSSLPLKAYVNKNATMCNLSIWHWGTKTTTATLLFAKGGGWEGGEPCFKYFFFFHTKI